MDYTKLSAIFEALIESDVNKLVVRVLLMLVNHNYFWYAAAKLLLQSYCCILTWLSPP